MTIKEKKFANDLAKCAGKYVATRDGKVIACGSSITEVMEKAAKTKGRKPAVFPLPKYSEGHNFF
jgi:hypothetical protein